MSPRKFSNDPDELMAEGKALILSLKFPRNLAEARFRHRVLAVLLSLSGMPAATLSTIYAESVNTLRLWVRTADEQGYAALRDKVSPGRRPSLRAEQEQELAQFLRSEPAPGADGVWNGPRLSTYLRERFDLSLSVRQCQRLLRRLLPRRLSRPAARKDAVSAAQAVETTPEPVTEKKAGAKRRQARRKRRTGRGQ